MSDVWIMIHDLPSVLYDALPVQEQTDATGNTRWKSIVTKTSEVTYFGAHDFEKPPTSSMTESQLWRKWTGGPKPQRRDHEATTCEFCTREKKLRETQEDLQREERVMAEPAYDLIECKTRERWLLERRSGIGASEAAAVLGASPWKSAVELWGEKVGIVAPSEAESEWLVWGRRLETAIREGYMEDTGRMVIRPGGPWTLVRSRKYPFLVTTLDGEIAPEDDHDGPGVFESKTAMMFRKDEWAEEPPLQYTIQNQHQLLVTTWTWGADAVLLGGSKMMHTDFAADPEFQELLLERLDAFWKLVQSETPPPMQGAEGSKELLLRLFPKAIAGKVVPLPHEAITWDQTLQDVKAQMKALEEQKEKLTAMFAEAIGDAEAGLLPDGSGYSYRLVEKKPYTVTPKPYRELRYKALKERR